MIINRFKPLQTHLNVSLRLFEISFSRLSEVMLSRLNMLSCNSGIFNTRSMTAPSFVLIWYRWLKQMKSEIEKSTRID